MAGCRIRVVLLVHALVAVAGRAAEPPAAAPLSGDSELCVSCHEEVHPGLVADWRSSRHAHVTVDQALAKPALERRVSSTDIPENLRGVAIGCLECHGLRPDQHKDNFEHFGYQINVIVTPDDCAACHRDETEQYAGSKKANAFDNLQSNPVGHGLVDTVLGVATVHDGKLSQAPASDSARANACFGCHGTNIEVNGTRTVTYDGDDIVLPELSGWPNQGVGRVNPDGSKGSCAACHPRHSFDIAIARQPYTCSQCHLDPDVPAFPVYMESKHGNIFATNGQAWQWDAVPWVPGRDFQAPTCATCHNSLLVSPAGKVIAERTHDFGARLWVRIFGLPYSHPQPKDGRTHLIRNADGLPLPTTFDNRPASDFLIDATEQTARRQVMRNVCQSCHSGRWADNHFARMDQVNAETDQMVLTATQLLQQAWTAKLADPTNPFDEAIERHWTRQWLFYADSVRYAAAMGGPDYAAFKNGWWELTENLVEMQDWLKQHQAK